MKKYLFCLMIMAIGLAFTPQLACAQSTPLGKGINKEGIKRNDASQRASLISILSQTAPSLGMSAGELIALYDSGVATIEIRNGQPIVTVNPQYIKKAPPKDAKEKKAARDTK